MCAAAALRAHPGLHVGEHVEDGSAAGVAVTEEGLLGGLHVVGVQAQLLLNFLDDRAAARVHQEVVEGRLEVGDVVLVHHTLDLHSACTVISKQPPRDFQPIQRLSRFSNRYGRSACARSLKSSHKEILLMGHVVMLER